MPSETTPLLDPSKRSDHVPRVPLFSPLRRVLFVALVSATSFAFTQTSLIYSFRVMTCDDYFDHHPSPSEALGDRCAIPVVEARTARAIALMSTATTFCSVLNLFVTGYWFKRLGIKTAMFQQTFWAALRSLTQIWALNKGGQLGINVITITQSINILGSGGGYELASMAYIAELCGQEERTGMFGVLMGMRMLGAAFGYICELCLLHIRHDGTICRWPLVIRGREWRADGVVGGMAFDFGGLVLPFQIAFCLLTFTTIFAAFFLPYIDPHPPQSETADSTQAEAVKEKRSRSFLHPLKIFIPRYVTLPSGKRRLDWNLTLLGLGAFFSVLATGYVGMGLQLVATNVFGFKPGPSGLMLVSRVSSYSIVYMAYGQSLNLAMRAFFLSILFPRIISRGRRFLSKPRDAPSPSPTHPPIESPLPSPEEAEPTTLLPPAPEPPLAEPQDTAHGSHFDLLFLQSSILLDGFLTAAVTFANQGWEMYIAAAILPFASGTGSAVKGVVMDLVGPEEKADALSAIALVEKLAQVSTISLFGFVFSALSEIGMPTAVFLANGAIAVVGFALLLFVRMPKTGPIALS